MFKLFLFGVGQAVTLADRPSSLDETSEAGLQPLQYVEVAVHHENHDADPTEPIERRLVNAGQHDRHGDRELDYLHDAPDYVDHFIQWRPRFVSAKNSKEKIFELEEEFR